MRVGEQAARDGPAGGVSSGRPAQHCIGRAVKRREDLPSPSPLNPPGVGGLAEFGTIGSVPAVVNVAIDALSPLWIVHLDMPLHPERVWRAIQAARAGLPS